MIRLTKQEITYNPRLIIVEHFDSIINLIDVRTEQLLLDTTLSEENKRELNELRQVQIKKLEEVKELNLANNSFTNETFEAKWQTLIDDVSNEYHAQLDLIKHDLIVIDCALVNDLTSKSKLALWIFRWFNTAKHLDFLK